MCYEKYSLLLFLPQLYCIIKLEWREWRKTLDLSHIKKGSASPRLARISECVRPAQLGAWTRTHTHTSGKRFFHHLFTSSSSSRRRRRSSLKFLSCLYWWFLLCLRLLLGLFTFILTLLAIVYLSFLTWSVVLNCLDNGNEGRCSSFLCLIDMDRSRNVKKRKGERDNPKGK